jgi:hypothetical protein
MNADEQDFLLWHLFPSDLISAQTNDSVHSSSSEASTAFVDPAET